MQCRENMREVAAIGNSNQIASSQQFFLLALVIKVPNVCMYLAKTLAGDWLILSTRITEAPKSVGIYNNYRNSHSTLLSERKERGREWEGEEREGGRGGSERGEREGGEGERREREREGGRERGRKWERGREEGRKKGSKSERDLWEP